jgi:hypothetical protein
MIVIRFTDAQNERRALGLLAGRFPFTTYATGETIVPDDALAALAVDGIPFHVEGPASYGQSIPALRTAAATEIQ